VIGLGNRNTFDLKIGLQKVEYIGKTVGFKRRGEPDEVVKFVGYLANEFSSFVQGANIVVDGGKAFNVVKLIGVGATTMNPIS
jgi:NAD(P)-dependent dehydrogenase (short-subunit alcohol dehydrogenase family)